MRLRHELDEDRLEQEQVNNSVQTQIQELLDQLNQAWRQLAKLDNAAHDHCVTCGARTPRVGQTECGRVDCKEVA